MNCRNCWKMLCPAALLLKMKVLYCKDHFHFLLWPSAVHVIFLSHISLVHCSHMPPTYLGHSCRHGLGHRMVYVNIYCGIIICSRHWLLAYLRSWAEFNFAGKPAFVGNEIFYVNIIWTICGYNVWRNNSIFSHNSILYRWNGWNLRQFDLHFMPIWVSWWSITDVPGRIEIDRRMLSLASAITLQVGRQHLRTRLYRYHLLCVELWGY